MLREQISELLKTSLKSGDTVAASTLRLVMAALKDQEIAQRTNDTKGERLDDGDIKKLLVTMVRQRKESIKAYHDGKREDLAQREQTEIDIISRFLPQQMSPKDIQTAVEATITEVSAQSIKDIGRVMTVLRKRHAHEMDFGQASTLVKGRLAL